MNKQDNYVSKTLKLLKLDATDIGNVYFYAILAGLISLGLPLGIQSIIGFVMAGQLSTSLILLISIVVLATFFYGFFQIRQLQITEKIKQKIFVRFSLAFEEKLNKLDVQYSRKYYLPELMNRFFDTITFQKSISKLLIDIPASSIQILLGLILLAFYHPLFILFGLFLIVTLYILLRYTGVRGMETSLEESKNKYELVAWLEELADNIKVIRARDTSHFQSAKTNKILQEYTESRSQHFKILKVQYWALTLFKVILTLVMLAVGSYLLIEQLINIGQFVAAEIIIILILSAIEKMIFGLDLVYDLLTSTEKLSKVIELAEINQDTNTSKLDVAGDELIVQNLRLSTIDNDLTILNDINFTLKKGDKLFISGASGSGKSSLMYILSGMYHRYEGRYTINDIIVKNLNNVCIKQVISPYYAGTRLFEGTILENINLGNEAISSSAIFELAKQIGFHETIAQLKKAYQTKIELNQNQVPAQVQTMVALLRTFINKKPIFILENPFEELEKYNADKLAHYIKNELNEHIVIYSTQLPELKHLATKTLDLTDNSNSNNI